MIIMPSNDRSPFIEDLKKRYPDKIGILNTPKYWKNPKKNEIWALDNGCFTKFDEEQYFKCLEKGKKYDPPLFVVLPDVLGCNDRTIALWNYYYPKIKKYDYPMAFVAQDGCKPKDIPEDCFCIFIGGFDPWKSKNIANFIGLKKWVHVGRVNGPSRLKHCHDLGVNSIDGTGWVRARERRFWQLREYIEGSPQKCMF